MIDRLAVYVGEDEYGREVARAVVVSEPGEVEHPRLRADVLVGGRPHRSAKLTATRTLFSPHGRTSPC